MPNSNLFFTMIRARALAAMGKQQFKEQSEQVCFRTQQSRNHQLEKRLHFAIYLVSGH